jgi:hypothetical protein
MDFHRETLRALNRPNAARTGAEADLEAAAVVVVGVADHDVAELLQARAIFSSPCGGCAMAAKDAITPYNFKNSYGGVFVWRVTIVSKLRTVKATNFP